MIGGLLKGKSVVITGAGSGVGRAASHIFAEHGARLVCTDINAQWLEETVEQVKQAGGDARAMRCDVSRKADLDAAVAAAVQAYGRLDVIYNNAGIASPALPDGQRVRLDENTEDQIELLIAVNVRGVMYGCQAAIVRFRIQGGGGVIVNTASAAGLMGWGGVLYGSTKGAIVNLTRALAMEVAGEGIRVNSVCPGAMATHFGIGARAPWSDTMLEKMAKAQPLGRIVDPADAANAALFLASDMARSITGVNLPVDAGMSAGR
jgi:NAD(P)-dependent dehydrogenase (short-subunit alcohol dehydrogenase family)